MMKRSVIALLALACIAAQAQEAKVSREREALRRAQAALRASQEQQSALQADKAKAEGDALAAQKDAASARTQAAGSAAQLKARTAEIEGLHTRLQAATNAQRQNEAKSAEREQVLQQELIDARQDAASRQQSNQALVHLLERSTKALADAEAKNRQMFALGQSLVQLYTGRSKLDTALQQDPVLGLTSVRLEDKAEQLRAALEAQRTR